MPIHIKHKYQRIHVSLRIDRDLLTRALTRGAPPNADINSIFKAFRRQFLLWKLDARPRLSQIRDCEAARLFILLHSCSVSSPHMIVYDLSRRCWWRSLRCSTTLPSNLLCSFRPIWISPVVRLRRTMLLSRSLSLGRLPQKAHHLHIVHFWFGTYSSRSSLPKHLYKNGLLSIRCRLERALTSERSTAEKTMPSLIRTDCQVSQSQFLASSIELVIYCCIDNGTVFLIADRG